MLTLSTLDINVMLSSSTYHIGETVVIALHLSAALAALIIGTAVLLRQKGTASHKLLGRTWVLVMLVAAVTSFWIRRDGFSWIHLLSVWTLISLACAVWFIRRGGCSTASSSRPRPYSGSMPAALSAAAMRGPSAFARSNT